MNDIAPDRRVVLLSPLLSALAASVTQASPIDPSETFVLQKDQIKFRSWGNIPPHSGETAMLYGDLDKPGPYLVLMRWNPGWFSAPHTYATDRIQVVLSGTWWVNSGADFTPRDAVPVPAGGFAMRRARTPHYDGVPHDGKEPVEIAVLGMGPVDMALVDPTKPSWRQV